MIIDTMMSETLMIITTTIVTMMIDYDDEDHCEHQKIKVITCWYM